jgi:hypothetical protein
LLTQTLAYHTYTDTNLRLTFQPYSQQGCKTIDALISDLWAVNGEKLVLSEHSITGGAITDRSYLIKKLRRLFY